MEGWLVDIPLANPAVPALLVVLAVGAAVAAWRAAPNWFVRAGLGVVSVVLLFGSGLAAVNAYIDYLPSAKALFGPPARDFTNLRPARLAATTLKAVPLRGVVESVRIPGVRSHFPARSAEIYLPPIRLVKPTLPLPVLLLLHGTPGTPADWTRSGEADVIADNWAVHHGGMAPIIVMPDVNGSFWGDTECLDGPSGKAETYLTQDVTQWVQAELHPSARRWAVAGLSEGGFCALQLAVHHPELYAAFGDFGGPDHATFDFGARPAPQQAILASRASTMFRIHTSGVAGWFESGTDDRALGGVVRAAHLARAAGLPTELVVRRGGAHSFRLWRHSLIDSFGWLATQLGLGADPPVDPV